MKDSRNAEKAAVFLAAAIMAAAGCSTKLVKTTPAAPAETSTAAAQADQNAEPSVRNDMFDSIPELKTIHFDYDSAALRPHDRAVIRSNAAWLKSHPDMMVQVAGHCDQRGTAEYNLALGQGRAAAVRSYYRMLGVPANRVATISYGKEKPICEEAVESCWRRNRRAETLAAYPQTVSERAKTPGSGN